MRIERVWRNRDDAFFAAVGVQLLALAVRALQQFVINAFGWNKHQGEVESVFRWQDIFFVDGIGVSLDRGDKRAAGFIAVGLNAAEGVERKLGGDGQDFFVAQKDGGIDSLAAGEAILRGVLRRRQRIFEQAIERDFTEDAAGFRSAEDGFE